MGAMMLSDDGTIGIIFDPELNFCGMWADEFRKNQFDNPQNIQKQFRNALDGANVKTSPKIIKEIDNGNFKILKNTTAVPKPGGIFIMAGDAISPLDKRFYTAESISIKKWWQVWK